MTAQNPQRTSPFDAFVADNLTILGQAVEFVGRLNLEAYGRPHPELGLSSIGSHLRHIVDFYVRFLETAANLPALEDEQGLPLLDYDRRERNPQLESDPQVALQTLRSLMQGLRNLPPGCMQRPLAIRTDCIDPEAQHESQSTVGRELQSLASHTVHHYALIKIAAGRVGVDPGREFGVAPSTLRFWERTGACAP